jgi:hypothetical protein
MCTILDPLKFRIKPPGRYHSDLKQNRRADPEQRNRHLELVPHTGAANNAFQSRCFVCAIKITVSVSTPAAGNGCVMYRLRNCSMKGPQECSEWDVGCVFQQAPARRAC